MRTATEIWWVVACLDICHGASRIETAERLLKGHISPALALGWFEPVASRGLLGGAENDWMKHYTRVESAGQLGLCMVDCEPRTTLTASMSRSVIVIPLKKKRREPPAVAPGIMWQVLGYSRQSSFQGLQRKPPRSCSNGRKISQFPSGNGGVAGLQAG